MITKKQAAKIRKKEKKPFVYLRIGNLFVYLRTEAVHSIEIIKVDMSKQPFTEDQIQLARIAKALGHPVRIAILQMLAAQSCCYHGDMSEVIPVAKSTLSQHLHELKEAGLIQGEFTPPTVKYCINHENWAAARELLGGFIDHVARVENYC